MPTAKTQAQLIGAIGKQPRSRVPDLGEMPVDLLQSFFASLDPLSLLAKFRRFAELDPDSDQAAQVRGAGGLAERRRSASRRRWRASAWRWYGENTTALGKWRIEGEPVTAGAVRLPALAMVPSGDRIVPPQSALGLARRLPRCETMTPAAGHIGMMVGGSRRAPRCGTRSMPGSGELPQARPKLAPRHSGVVAFPQEPFPRVLSSGYASSEFKTAQFPKEIIP